jgi:hypothetical protein
MGLFVFKLVTADGTPAEPSELHAAVSNMRPGDTIALSRDRVLGFVAVREQGDDEPLVLVVEDVA